MLAKFQMDAETSILSTAKRCPWRNVRSTFTPRSAVGNAMQRSSQVASSVFNIEAGYIILK